MIEGLLEVVCEFVLEIVFEFIADVFGWNRDSEPVHPLLSAISYAILGAALGGVSLLIWPHHFLHSQPARVANLVVSPFAAGSLFAALGQWRMRRGRSPAPLEKFANGFLFALSFSTVRFVFGRL